MFSSTSFIWFNAMLHHIRVSIVATLLLAVICCGVYPMLVWGASQALFHDRANGSLITRDGSPTDHDAEAVGSALLGQSFTGAKYFHPRPSAAGAGYDPTSSGGSNLGPTSAKMIGDLKLRASQYAQENHVSAGALIAADAVTASASGLDPHISVANANAQSQRVAEHRKLSIERVKALIAKNTDGPDFGILGDKGVNVLKLNIALDREKPVQ
jgi:K+-transporting ATPase ATPase C chain